MVFEIQYQLSSLSLHEFNISFCLFLLFKGNFNEHSKSIIRINVTARVSDSRVVNSGSKTKLGMTAKFGSLLGTTEVFQVIKRNGNERAIISMNLQEIHETGKDKQLYVLSIATIN